MKSHSTLGPSASAEDSPIRERLTDLPMGQGLEARAGALLRAAADARIPAPDVLAALGTTLHESERKRPRPLRLQLAVTLALMLTSGVLSAGITLAIKARSTASKAETATPVAKPAARARPSRHPGRLPGASPEPAEAPGEPGEPVPPSNQPSSPSDSTSVAPPKAAPDEQRPAPRLRESRPAPALPAASPGRALALRDTAVLPQAPTSPPAALQPAALPQPLPQPSALARESRLVREAMARLRDQGDAQAALGLLDARDAEFGGRGALGPEATTTRVEALLRLGRHPQALALLDALALSPARTTRGLLLARADLRAETGRLSAALLDYDRLLASPSGNDEVAERALMGRAACRSNHGDRAGALADLRTYVSTYPGGRFAAQARAGLAAEKP